MRLVMDAKAVLRYGTGSMRLLLLLSALFAALAGSVGTCAAAQPVQASAVAATAVAAASAMVPGIANRPRQKWSHRPSVLPLASRLADATVGQPPIFASRRRE